MNAGYSVSGSISPPKMNISFWVSQNTGATSCIQNASIPIHRCSATSIATAATANGMKSAMVASGGVQRVNANAQTNAVAPSTGIRSATAPMPAANSAITNDAG